MEDNRTNGPYSEVVCSVCCLQIKSSDCELLEGTILEVLEAVLIKLNLTTILPVICNDCNRKLLDAFQHKSKWIYTEDLLFPYVNSAIDGKVDIKTVYLSEHDYKESDFETDTQICRLCMGLINNKSWNVLFEVLDQCYSLEIFEKHVPELNLYATENPIICKMCLDSLNVFMDFVAFYQSQNVKTEDYFEVKDETTPEGINPALVQDLGQNELEYHVEIFKCTKCLHVSTDESNLLKHVTIHEAKKRAELVNRQMKMFKCAFCSYETTHEKSLQQHILIHKSLSEVEVFRCDLCPYISKFKGTLQRHLLIHKPVSSVTLFNCDLCPYKTKYKGNLQNHIVIHKPPSGIKGFKCEFCSFETKHKRYIQQHILIHKPLSKVDVFKCELCSYETIHKRNRKQHILTHKALTEVEVFKCELCCYKTKYKANIQRHVLSHKPFPSVTI